MSRAEDVLDEHEEGRPPSEGEGGRKASQASRLVALAEDAELFHTPEGEPYATIPAAGGHRETWPLRRDGFRDWLAHRFYRGEGSAPGSQAMQDALAALGGRARFDGPERAVHLRVAEHEGGIYLDLGDERWRVVEVDRAGWRLVDTVPVRFRRPRSMRALPIPLAGGSLAELRPFVNVAEGDWALVAAFLVAALRPTGPYPVLALHGEQGAAKSTTARVLRALIDPSAAPLRGAPRDERDLAAAADNGWVVALDNLSGISQALSDSLSRLATGAGFGARALYTDADEHVIEAARPAIITGIAEVASASDLLDRALILSLPGISEGQRRDEKRFWADFELVRPRILGALLDALCLALRREPEVRLASAPRMADFARWAVAAEPALGLAAGEFMASYAGNRAGVHELALDSALGAALREVGGTEGGFEGSWAELLERLAEEAGEKAARGREWPRNTRALSGHVRRLAPNLRGVGIGIVFGREDRRRWIALGTGAQSTVTTVIDAPDGSTEAPESTPQAASRPETAVTQVVTVDDPGDAGTVTTPARPSPRDSAAHADRDGDDGSDGELRTSSNGAAPDWREEARALGLDPDGRLTGGSP